MPKKVIVPTSLNFQPRPSYPYSPGAQAGGMIFTAGQVAWDESGKIIAIGDIRGQTQQTLKNVRAVLNAGGADFDDVVKCNVYLKDMNDFKVMNEEFLRAFPNNPPARTTVQTPMAEKDMLVEIEVVAFVGTI